MDAFQDIKNAVWLAAEWKLLRREFEAFPDKEFLRCRLLKKRNEPDPKPARWSIRFIGRNTSILDKSEQYEWQRMRTEEFELLVNRAGLLLEATWPGYGQHMGAIVPLDLWAENLVIPRWRDWKEPTEPFSLYPLSGYVECSVDNIAERSISQCREYEQYALDDSYSRVQGIPPNEAGAKTPVDWLKQKMAELSTSVHKLKAFGGPDPKTVRDILDGERRGRIETWGSICEALTQIGTETVTPADVPNLETFLNSPKNSR